ncbi:hypothetical protein [Tenacibaculum soleae]|uniref:Uncharacterized protein n=1 Tax=Tenacibaculum soleae TaxID=447689 RepID=A0A1B9XWH8_9FLAO|nr:hypothetical protein [Tenacibaculum soleae]MDO6744955.1 hypothetical protein [Tenacibaculum soleae]MDO6813749.1 hypothetical protein [Tenacibaculum soleae]OCK41914.1 hypothetical protein BA195_13100 [Tenacibaculum soleae]
MKNLFIGLLLVGVITTVNSQTEVVKTTKVEKSQKVDKNGVKYNTKVKVVTEKSQKVKFNPNQKNKLNQKIVDSPITVTKNIMVDNDKDPFYDTKTKVTYFKYKQVKYDFLINQNDLLITYKLKDKDITSAKALKSINNNFYVVAGNDFNGVGYFNSQGDFIVEYKDKKSDKLEYATFETFKM